MKSVVQFRTDNDLKEEAKEILASMQVDMTTYLNMALAQLVRIKRIPFEVVGSANEEKQYQQLVNELEKAEKDIKQGRTKQLDAVMKKYEVDL
ncbi:MAG: type II toxin-antitoxin system RelB/DinJ family antitoxin [Streptococcaceae bacterium]|nr:type II toxin-antitoxin system RelB/DinJ family antitoxin [Streptococcaceae bacterium]